MSISRGNWSSLSRLAQQWIEDDEEEQIRERRRRNRETPTSNRVVEVFTENGSALPISSDANPKDKEFLNKEQPESLQVQNEEKTTKPEQHNESNKLTSIDIEETKGSIIETPESKQPESVAMEKRQVTIKNEDSQIHANTNNIILNQRENTKSNSQNNLIKKQQYSAPEDVKGTKKNQNVGRLNQLFTNWKEKDQTAKVQHAQLQETRPKTNKNIEEQKSDVLDSKEQILLTQGKDPSSTFTDPISTKPPEPQNETNIKPNHESQSTYKTRVFVSSVKIPRRSSSSCSIKSPPPVQEEIEEEPSQETKAAKCEVLISAVSSSNVNSKQDSPPSSQQTSTSFVRLGPLSSSVRIKSQSEDDKDDSGFTRRSSLRLSLRSRNIEDRMEKYTSAIQRSASLRISPSHSRGVVGASDGVATKRSIFEKDGENSAQSNISHKGLTRSGSVTTRINQWSNKAQQSSNTVTGTKGFKTGDVATKRMLWQQISQSSSDTKL